MTKKSLKERLQKLAGIPIKEQYFGGASGCSDPAAINYDEDALGDTSAYGTFSCQYSYGCSNFEQWAIQLHGLALLNEYWNDKPFPHIVEGVNSSPEMVVPESPYSLNPGAPWSAFNPSTEGMVNYICDWVCATAVEMNTGQYCPACWAGSGGFSFSSNDGVGLDMCQCCVSLINETEGCTDPNALNYDELAIIDDGSCEYPVTGCMDTNADNFNPEADGPCNENTSDCPVGIGDALGDNCCCEYLGCTDETALNYNPDANIDDGSCDYPGIPGCTDPNADNYNPEAEVDDGNCDYLGCTSSDAVNYDPIATTDDGSCLFAGCTDPNAINYDPDAVEDDGSCYYNPGCTDPQAENYDPNADYDDGSCEIDGCMSQGAANYDPDANINYTGPESPNFDEFGCMWLGCMDEEALNYDPEATYGPPNTTMTFIQNVNTGALITMPQCEYSQPACIDETACNYGYLGGNATVQNTEILVEPDYYNDTDLCVYPNECDSCEGDESCFGCTDPDAVNYEDSEEITFNDGSCYYELECYRCEYPPGPIAYGTPGELFTEIFYVNPETGDPDTGTGDAFGILIGCPAEGDFAYGPNINDGNVPENWNFAAEQQDYDFTSEELDCGGTHTTSTGKIECYQCEYPWPPISPYAGGEVISQTFVYGTVGYDDPVCPEDWFENVEDLETNDQGIPCGPDPTFPESEKFYRCKIVSINIDGTENGECVESSMGPYGSMQQCEDAGCGDRPKKKKRCYTCKGTNPVGWEFDDPPGCPKGWQSEPPTMEDCDPCIDPLVNQWLNLPLISITFHCCHSYNMQNSSAPTCYEIWEELGGDPSVDPHECCPSDPEGMPSGPGWWENTDGESDSGQDTTTYLQPKDKLRERFQKLAGVKKRK